jgi:hypothetical protein
MCSSVGDYRGWWTHRQNSRQGIDIEEEQASRLKPQSILVNMCSDIGDYMDWWTADRTEESGYT